MEQARRVDGVGMEQATRWRSRYGASHRRVEMVVGG